MRKQLILAQVAGLCLVGGIARAGVIGGAATSVGDDFAFVPPPANVGNDNQQDNNTLYAFNERQNYLLAAALAVDSLNGGGPGLVPANTYVSSHYVFFDPQSGQSIIGHVDFDGTVIGIITDRDRLIASDYLGAPGTNYLSPGARGLEAGDTVVRDGGIFSRVNADLTASSPGDYVRVITASSAPVPLPPAAWAGLALLVPVVGRSISRRIAAKNR